MRAIIAPSLAVILLSAALGSCGGGNDGPGLQYCSSKLDGDYLVGEMFPFKGTLGSFGPYLDQAVYQALTEINAAGGINGKKIGYVQCDTQTEPTIAVEAAYELLNNFQIPIIIGPVSSRNTLAIADFVISRKVVILSPVNQLPSLTYLEDDGFYFRACASTSVQVPIVARITLNGGWMKSFAFHQDDPYGNAMYEVFAGEYTKEGGQVDHFFYRETDENYPDRAVAAAKAYDPTAIINMTYVDDGAAILKASNGWRQPTGPQWVIVNGQMHPEFIMKAGIDNLKGAVGTCVANANNADYDRFETKFKEMWNTPPFDFSANAYDAVYLAAIAMALSADPADGTQVRDNLANTKSGTDVHPQEWAKVLTLLPDGQMNYEGASGPVDFDQYGDVLQNIQEWLINDTGVFENTRCWQLDPQGAAIVCP